MDAVKFLREKKRMCDWYYYSNDCKGCPLEPATEYGGYPSCDQVAEKDPYEVVRCVEEWSEKHPIITNAIKKEKIL